ncbi:hypothetical protein KHA96_12850 [Bacillus sp. FJAT-49711]|uniref:hypothetical protein n=1 Tax=Bacillus sp. FJAT-49711 TaxID=2833585 RepID=UPI001BC9C2D4|nr:hypothetical protein [Bacillus sp. FJAT-49711]MBS4219206.1 hypothetical protein [Bacillus sp. FJAT-49711]
MKQGICGAILYIMLMVPPIKNSLESIMILHMLVQLPLLILVGWLIGKLLLKKYNGFFTKWNKNGIPGMLMVVIITTYWMLPRILDEALSVWSIELFKFIGLPCLVGVLLRDSWKKIQAAGKSFIFLNYISMFGLMSWLYIDSPIQICNNYLEIEQQMLGWGFLMVTVGMIFYMLQMVFIDHSEE